MQNKIKQWRGICFCCTIGFFTLYAIYAWNIFEWIFINLKIIGLTNFLAGFWLRLWLLCKLFCAERSADFSKIFYLCLLYCLVLLVFVFVFHSCFIQQTFVDILFFFFVVDMFLISFFSFASQNLAFRTYLLYFFFLAHSRIVKIQN